MRKLCRKMKRIVAMILAVAIGVGCMTTTVANAAELPVEDYNISQVEGSTRSREITAIGDGTISIYLLGEFRFTDWNRGSYNTIKASRMKYEVYIRPLPGESIDFTVSCWQYGSEKPVASVMGGNYGDLSSDGYYRYESEWFNVAYGVDYNFTYWCRQAGIYEPATMDVKMIVLVQ